MRHGDAFAGIGGFGLAAKRVGWETVWACEIEPSARAIYQARLGHEGLRFDTDIRESRELPTIDILTGGFPCQDLSVAGKRRGLAGERSGLFFELARILQESRPEWFVFENVPGLLSSNSGRDMGVALSTLVECGYGVAYRVLNAQFFGVAQRRRRVFFVGHSSGDERRAAAVLFEREGMSRNPSKERETWSDVAHCVASHAAKGGDPTTDNYVTGTLTAKKGRGWHVAAEDARDNQIVVAHSLRAEGFDASEDGTGRGTPLVAPALRCGGMADGKRPAGSSYDNTPLAVIHADAVGRDGISINAGPDAEGRIRKRDAGLGIIDDGTTYSLTTGEPHAVAFAKSRRAHTPDDYETWKDSPVANTLGARERDYSDVEGKRWTSEGNCFRLVNAFPSPPPNADRVRTSTGFSRSLDVCEVCEEGPDSPRYRGLGNAVAVPVVSWIFERIEGTRTP